MKYRIISRSDVEQKKEQYLKYRSCKKRINEYGNKKRNKIEPYDKT